MQRPNVLPIEEVATLLKDCPADVLIISDSCYVQPDWPDLFSEPVPQPKPKPIPQAKPIEGKRPDPRPTPARVFLGNADVCYEDTGIGGCLLTHLVVRGMGGEADEETPSTFTQPAPEDPFTPFPPRLRVEPARPDGFVTLQELVGYVHRRFGMKRLATEAERETRPSLVFKGWFGDRDVVLTRPIRWSRGTAAFMLGD